MVAFNCSRRRYDGIAHGLAALESLAASSRACPLDSTLENSASHRAQRDVEVRRNQRSGEIFEVRIGRWRTVAATADRRLAEVRTLVDGRVALRIERFANGPSRPSSEIWLVYCLEGRLEAALQTSPDGSLALVHNYRTRQASRLAADGDGKLTPVETWRF